MLAVEFENNAGAFELAARGGLGVERFPALCGCTVFGTCKPNGCGPETDMGSTILFSIFGDDNHTVKNKSAKQRSGRQNGQFDSKLGVSHDVREGVSSAGPTWRLARPISALNLPTDLASSETRCYCCGCTKSVNRFEGFEFCRRVQALEELML